MALENLFATDSTVPNVHKTKLPENPEKWAETLTTQLREQHPDVAKVPVTVEFRKRDDQAGTAIGALRVVSPEANRSAYVPFVIDKFELYPLDIWMESKTQAVHPLTKDTFKELFFVQNFAEGMDNRPQDGAGQYFNDPSMWTQTYPPLQGRYSYASAGYHMLDQIEDTMTEDALHNFRNALREAPMSLKKFEANGHGEIIRKLAAKKTAANLNDYKASAESLLPKSIIDIKKDGYNRYSLLAMTEGVYDLASSVTMDRNQCVAYLGKIIGKAEDILNDVDRNGEKTLILRPPATEGVWLYDGDEKGPVEADRFTCYWVKNKTGLLIDALVIPKLVDFAGKPKSGKLVLSRTHSCVQNSVAGIEYPDSKCIEEVMKGSDLRIGQLGTFVYVSDGKAIATYPGTIEAIEVHSYSAPKSMEVATRMSDVKSLTLRTLDGKTCHVRCSYSTEFRKESPPSLQDACVPKGAPTPPPPVTLESLGFAETKKDCYVIPEKMVWIALHPMTDVASTKEEWMLKTAGEKMDIDPVQVRVLDKDLVEIRGHGLPKIATDLRRGRALLLNLGVPVEKVAAVLKKAKHTGCAKVHKAARLRSKDDVEKKAQYIHAQIKEAAARLTANADFVKVAAEIDHTQTVDALLSLNFLNAGNMAKFITYRPGFEACADKLAELTLAARLGLKAVPQAAVSGAMAKLLEVIEGLKRTESALKPVNEKQ